MIPADQTTDEPQRRPLHVRLRPSTVLRALGAIAGFLVAAGIVSVLTRTVFDRTLRDAVWLFDLSGDISVPSWFASMTLLLAAVLLTVLWWDSRGKGERDSRHWAGLAAIFLFMSVDEVATIHEWAGNATEAGTDGFLLYAWVLLAIPFVVVVGLIYTPFLRRLPSDIRRLFVAAGGLYVGGALIVEMVNARLDSATGAETTSYGLLTAFEEGMEMAGAVLFVYAVTLHLRRRGVRLQVDFGG